MINRTTKRRIKFYLKTIRLRTVKIFGGRSLALTQSFDIENSR